LAAATPVLVADTSSLPEVVRKAECRFPLQDESVLATKLASAADNPEMYGCPFPAEFDEEFGLARYLQLLDLPGATVRLDAPPVRGRNYASSLSLSPQPQ
jgi:hypothetical protein